MGTTGDPSFFGAVIGFICIAPWLYMLLSALRDKPRQPKQQAQPYREIQPRNMADERAGFVEAKMQKIERAMR